MSALYRVQQFLAALWPRVTPSERTLVAECLPPAAAALFGRMARRDQRHSLDVFHRVRQAAPDQTDLAAAALLHDAAKTALPGRRLRLHHRVLIVLLQATRPGWMQQIARNDPGSWRYPFYLHMHHPALSAELAQRAGCTPLTVALIRSHQERLAHAPVDETERLLALLQRADDAS
ncbi:MAG: hypothetical protein V9H69_11560 [Anaerolineae bacterium]|jgi:hypothetical protein